MFRTYFLNQKIRGNEENRNAIGYEWGTSEYHFAINGLNTSQVDETKNQIFILLPTQMKPLEIVLWINDSMYVNNRQLFNNNWTPYIFYPFRILKVVAKQMSGNTRMVLINTIFLCGVSPAIIFYSSSFFPAFPVLARLDKNKRVFKLTQF